MPVLASPCLQVEHPGWDSTWDIARAHKALADVTDSKWRWGLIDNFLHAYVSLSSDPEDGGREVAVLGARRQVALAHLLQINGITVPGQGRVLSDRFMALEPDYWNGKRAILCDDTSKTGATGDRAVELAKALKISFDQESHAAIRLTKREASRTAALHEQLARSFARSAVPLFSDFCMSEATDLGLIDAAKLLSPNGTESWRIVDVSNAAIADIGARAYSFLPRGEFLDDLSGLLGPVASLVDVVKYRLFTHTAFMAFDTRIRVVPVVILKPLPREKLREWMRVVGLTVADRSEFLVDSQSRAAATLIGFWLSRRLLDAFRERVMQHHAVHIKGEDEWVTNLAMTSRLQAITAPDSEHWASLSSLVPLTGRDCRLPAPVIDWPDETGDSRRFYTVLGDQKAIGDADAHPVEGVTKGTVIELLPRVIARLQEEDTKADGRRRPLSFSDLGEAMGLGNLRPPNGLALSVLLDVLNDLGHAVPVPMISQPDADTVSRGYKIGEFAAPVKGALTRGEFAAFPRCVFPKDTLEPNSPPTS